MALGFSCKGSASQRASMRYHVKRCYLVPHHPHSISKDHREIFSQLLLVLVLVLAESALDDLRLALLKLSAMRRFKS